MSSRRGGGPGKEWKWGVYCLPFKGPEKGFKYMKVTTDSMVARALSTKGGSFKDKEKYQSRINGKQAGELQYLRYVVPALHGRLWKPLTEDKSGSKKRMLVSAGVRV